MKSFAVNQSDGEEEVELLEEVITVDVENHEVSQEEFESIMVIGENGNKEKERILGKPKQNWTLREHDYTTSLPSVSLHNNLITLVKELQLSGLANTALLFQSFLV